MSTLPTVTRPPIVIEIGGQRLRLNANTDGPHLAELARVVNERFVRIQGETRSPIPATVLALVALQLADELDDARRKQLEATETSQRAVTQAEGRAREVEQMARRAVIDAIAEIDRTLLLDDEQRRKDHDRAANDTETA